jgi:hypothetical protein
MLPLTSTQRLNHSAHNERHFYQQGPEHKIMCSNWSMRSPNLCCRPPRDLTNTNGHRLSKGSCAEQGPTQLSGEVLRFHRDVRDPGTQDRLLFRLDLMRDTGGCVPPPPLEPAVEGGLFMDVVAPSAVLGLHDNYALSHNACFLRFLVHLLT